MRTESQEVTRRDAIRIGFGGLAALAGLVASGHYAFQAFGDGEGHDATDDSQAGGGGGEYSAGKEFIWFDRGGFTSSNGDGQGAPAQGWGDDSINYFLNLMNQKIAAHGHTPSNVKLNSTHRRSGLSGSSNNRTDADVFWETARNAITRAVSDSNEYYSRIGSDVRVTRGRVVAVAWTWVFGNSFDHDNDWGFVYASNWHRSFTDMFPRRPYNSELNTKKNSTDLNAWETENFQDTNDKWIKMIYDRPRTNLPGQHSLIVIAVADGEPPETGSVVVKKVVRDGSDSDKAVAWPMRLTVKDASGNPLSGKFGGRTYTNGVTEFTVRHGGDFAAAGLPNRATFEISELPLEDRGNKIEWTITKGTIDDNKATGTIVANTVVTATCTNSMVGYVRLHKDSTE